MGERLRPQDHRVRYETVGEWKLRVTSYKLGDKFICSVDNMDPGATLTWKEGASREEAESKALEQARKSVRATRKSG